MKIIAQSATGAEFMYNPHTAHKVSKRSAVTIMNLLNACKYQLKEGTTWALHDVDMYDNAYYIAQEQRFTIRKGILKEYR